MPWLLSNDYLHGGRKGSFLLLVALSALSRQVSGKKNECYADLNGPKDDPNNIYTCQESEKCCQEGGQPTCCAEKDPSDATWEQVQLWGTLCVMIIILAFVMWYCRHDGDCCGNKKDAEGKETCCCLDKCCCCCFGKKEKQPEIEEVMEGEDCTDDEEYESEELEVEGDDATPGPAVYEAPDANKYPAPSKDEIPEPYRDVDVEKAA